MKLLSLDTGVAINLIAVVIVQIVHHDCHSALSLSLSLVYTSQA